MHLLLLLAACSGKPSDGDDTGTGDSADTDTAADTDTDTDADSDTDSDTDTDTDTDPGEMPADPRPLVLSVSGTYNGTLTFDAPTCTWYDGIPNFRAFWRIADGSHVFVLVAEVIGPFAGAGTYDQTQTTTRVKLQEEAGGSGYYFGTDTAQGDTVSVTIDAVDAKRAWGEFSFNSLHGTDGSVTVSPQPIPIWCPTMN